MCILDLQIHITQRILSHLAIANERRSDWKTDVQIIQKTPETQKGKME